MRFHITEHALGTITFHGDSQGNAGSPSAMFRDLTTLTGT
jgi:hypothetical protein